MSTQVPAPGRSWPALVVFLLVCFGVAATGAMYPPGQWHAALTKPSWNPPNQVFGPVWTVLYITIAVSGWLVWRRAGLRGARGAFALYALQLALNGAWSWLFFGLHRPGLAFAEILVLWSAILATVIAFYRVERRAGLLLVPYLAWVSFAAVLNGALWRLNA